MIAGLGLAVTVTLVTRRRGDAERSPRKLKPSFVTKVEGRRSKVEGTGSKVQGPRSKVQVQDPRFLVQLAPFSRVIVPSGPAAMTASRVTTMIGKPIRRASLRSCSDGSALQKGCV